ncbi:MAG: ferrous iron transport protein A [Firmicutes bacterium]|nr:ferrous iron transport protein A [Bacillota bacterium]
MPLVIADLDREYIIKKVGGSSEVRNHLNNLGFNIGTVIKVISTVGGNLIVCIKDTRIALDKALAQKITV